MTDFNIPKQFTQGDRVSWTETFTAFDNSFDTLSCFIRGQSTLDITGIPNDTDNHQWNFEIIEATSLVLVPGDYHCQFVVFGPGIGRKTLGIAKVEVCPSFEAMTALDTRTNEEKELEEVEKAIASLSNGVAEYYIGTRRVRHVDLSQLYERQKYLRNRIAKMKNKGAIGGINRGIRIS